MARTKPNLQQLAGKLAGASFVQGGAQQQFIKTRSPLDALLGGGLVEGTTTVVMGEAGQGKTALLQYIQGQIETTKPFKPGRSAYLGCGAQATHARFAWAHDIQGLVQLVEAVKAQTNGETVFCIDDVAMYAAGGGGIASSAKVWAQLMQKWNYMTLVLGVQAQRNSISSGTPMPGGSKALAFSAGTILSVQIQATIPNGVVLHVKTSKSRWATPGTSCLLSIVVDDTGLWKEEIP